MIKIKMAAHDSVALFFVISSKISHTVEENRTIHSHIEM
jgi:hypothetical protein